MRQADHVSSPAPGNGSPDHHASAGIAAVAVRDLTLRYPGADAPALKNVSLEIAAGSAVAVIGSSGAGKSTFLRCLNRLNTPSAGRVYIYGRDHRHMPLRELRGMVSMVFQRFHLIPRMDAVTNVMIGLLAGKRGLQRLFTRFDAEDRDAAFHALEKVGMLAFAYKDARDLSGGQQQRVAIARCLIQKPRIILADEPVASLDPVNARKVIELLLRLNREQGIAVIANLHQVEIAESHFDRIVALKAGELVFDSAAAGAPGKAAYKTIYGQSL